MGKRLNDTAAVVIGIGPSPVDKAGYKSVEKTVRPIDNGYIVRTSTSGDGRYDSKEEFSPDMPELEPASMSHDRGGSPDLGGSGSLSRARSYFEKNR